MLNTRAVCFAIAAMLALSLPATAQAHKPPKRGHKVFLKQANENRALSEVKLPLYRGTDASGGVVRFIVTDASSRKWAKVFGANFSPKLANAAGTGATTKVTWGSSGPRFAFTPNFSPPGAVIPGQPGAGTVGGPPAAVECPAGTSRSRVRDDIPVECSAPAADASNGLGGSVLATATGENFYTPLVEIQTPDGPVVLNAPHIANSTGKQDRALKLEGTRHRVGEVTYVLTAGVHKGGTVHYITTESSIPILGALESTTFTPALNRTPSTAHNETIAGTARSGLTIVTNGPAGLGNPQRQGINSAIFDGASTPLNIIQFTPDDVEAGGETLYSPIWDIHLATWKPATAPVRLSDFEAMFTNPAIEPADAIGALHPVVFWAVNCPIVSTDGEGVFNIPPPT